MKTESTILRNQRLANELLDFQSLAIGLSTQEIKNTEKELDDLLRRATLEGEAKVAKATSRMLKRIQTASDGDERQRAENNLNTYLNEKASPVAPHEFQLDQMVNNALDRKDPKLDEILNTASNSGLSTKQKIKALNNIQNEKIPDVYHIKSVKGIPNCGNTCFMNAGFQLILNDPALLAALVETYQSLISEPECDGLKRFAYDRFLKAVSLYQTGKESEIDLSSLRILFSDPNTKKLNAFGDVTEFIDALLQPVDQKKYPHLFCKISELKTFKPNPHPSKEMQDKLKLKKEEFEILKEIPGWVEKNYTTLSSDGKIKKTEKLSNLMIPVPDCEETVRGQDIIDAYFSNKKTIDPAEAIYLQNGELKCFSLESSQNTLDISPQVLNISFNRFRNDGSKIETQVEMPKKIQIFVNGLPQNYELQSVAIHTGAHYIALIKKGNQSFIANDSSISDATSRNFEHALTSGYLYSYRKCSNSVREKANSSNEPYLRRLFK